MRLSSRITFRHIQVLVLCLFVCVFCAHAKLSVYQQPQANSANTTTHLWVDGQKIEVQEHSSSILPLPVIVFLVLAVPLVNVSRRDFPVEVPSFCPLLSFSIQQYFRPPPALQSIR